MKSTVPYSIRQGDVLLFLQCKKPIPKGAKLLDGPIILAFGEVTGHKHQIVLDDFERTKVCYWDAGAERFLQVMETVPLVHEEHEVIPIPPSTPSIYQQGFQVEERGPEVRRVTD